MTSYNDTSSVITIYYYSAWHQPIIHYDKGRHRGWTDLHMKGTERENWFRVDFSNYDLQHIEFVICDENKLLWDKPGYNSPCSRGDNYFLNLDDFVNSDNHDIHYSNKIGVYTLVKGILTKVVGSPILLVTDLDGTLLGHDEYLENFNDLWLRKHVWRGSQLIYTTGRNLKDFLCASTDYHLLQPDFAVCGVGTEIYTFSNEPLPTNTIEHILESKELLVPDDDLTDPSCLTSTTQDANLRCPKWCPSRLHATFDSAWLSIMRKEFHRAQAVKTARILSGEVFVNGNIYHDPWRLSLSVNIKELDMLKNLNEDHEEYQDRILQHLMDIFKDYKLLISGCGDWRYLDVLPSSGGKLISLQYLMNKTGFLPNHTLVCGDSGNDVDMFAAPDVCGCSVGNSQPELRDFLQGKHGLAKLRGLTPTANVFFATFPCAGGILQALDYFKF